MIIMNNKITLPIQYDTRGLGDRATEYKDAILREFPSAELVQLPIADLVCGSAAIEIKTVPDFLASISDGRLAHQPVHMKEQFEYPLFLILGSLTDIIAQNLFNGVALKHRLEPEELKHKRQIRIHENSILAALSAIVVRHKIPVMLLEDFNMTSLFDYIDKKNPLYPAYVLECIDFVKLYKTEDYKYIHAFKAIRYFIEKANDGKTASNNVFRRTPSMKDQQIGIVSQLPSVGRDLSVKLLTDFKTVQNLFNQTPEKLTEVDGVGTIIAERIHEIVTREYYI